MWGFMKRVENLRFVERFVMYVSVETMQNWYQEKLGCLHLGQGNVFIFYMRTLMSDPKPTWPHILALIMADQGDREEQWTKLNS